MRSRSRLNIKTMRSRLWEIPAKKCKFQSCYLCKKKTFFRCKIWRGVGQWCYFHFSVLHTLVNKRIWKFYLWTFSKPLDDVKAIFELIDLKFGVYIVHTCMKHMLGIRFLIFRVFVSTFDYFLKISGSKMQNFEIMILNCVFRCFTIWNFLIIEGDVAL